MATAAGRILPAAREARSGSSKNHRLLAILIEEVWRTRKPFKNSFKNLGSSTTLKDHFLRITLAAGGRHRLRWYE
jgi:hypothetical protein